MNHKSCSINASKIIVSKSSDLIKSDINTFYNNVVKSQSKAKFKKPRLRPSSLPSCSLLYLYQIIKHSNKHNMDTAFISDYFMSIGTEVHKVMNIWCRQVNRNKEMSVWGNWKCSNKKCGNKWKYTDKDKCNKCGRYGTYCEISIKYGGMRGHIDCILITKNGIIVVDYKTASSYKAQIKKFEGINNMTYSLQLFAYTYMLEKVWGKLFMDKYNKKIIGSALLFISRDNPTKFNQFNWKRKTSLETGKELVTIGKKRWDIAKKSFDSKKLSKELFKYRLCESNDDYKDRISKFFPYGGCPLYEECMGSESESIKHTRKYLKTMIDGE